MTDIIKIREPKKVWFTADTHYWHKNITYGESVWANKETGCRRFDTTQEMSRHVVEQINKYVGQDDILIHLGDWSFSGIENIWNFYKQLIVKNIYLCIGNHDNNIRKNYILPNVYRAEPHSSILLDGKGIYQSNSEYPDYVEAQSLFTVVDDYMEIMIEKNLFCCMHYPIDEWNDRHHKAFMLHGHQHGNNTYKKGRLDVGMDNAYKLFGEYKPFSYEDIMEIFKNQK